MKRFWIFSAKKGIVFLVSIWVVATVTFFLMHAVPGDPFTQEQALPKEILRAMQKHYGLDKPLGVQYLKYLKGLVTFDFGPSMRYHDRSVTDLLIDGFPVSFCLGLEALFLSIVSGLALGTISALFQGRLQDRLVLILSILGISVPSFIAATFLQYIFAVKWHLLPIARWGSFAHTILPAVSLSALPSAFIARLCRSGIIEVLEQDYIQTARSKGVSLFRLITRHVLRNASAPVLGYLGSLTASVLTGSFAIEKIFGIPGLGRWFVIGISNRDYPVIMGFTIFYSVILLFSVLLTDLLSSLVDPRIRLERTVR